MSKTVKVRNTRNGKEFSVSEDDAKVILKNPQVGAGYVVVGEKVPEEVLKVQEKRDNAMAKEGRSGGASK